MKCIMVIFGCATMASLPDTLFSSGIRLLTSKNFNKVHFGLVPWGANRNKDLLTYGIKLLSKRVLQFYRHFLFDFKELHVWLISKHMMLTSSRALHSNIIWHFFCTYFFFLHLWGGAVKIILACLENSIRATVKIKSKGYGNAHRKITSERFEKSMLNILLLRRRCQNAQANFGVGEVFTF